MNYNNTPITCKICKEDIPCVFDDQDEVTVARIASQSAKKDAVPKKLSEKEKKSEAEAMPDRVLIYLTCLNGHGPFAYPVNINK